MLRLAQCLVVGRWIARTRQRHIRVLGLKPNKGLDDIAELLDAGSVAPSIDRVYPLREVPQAIRRFGDADHKGKIIVSIADARPI